LAAPGASPRPAPGRCGRLAVTLTSVAPGTIPSTNVTGTVAIDPSAALNLAVAPGAAVAPGSNVVLIGNDASDAIGGQFTGIPNNSVLSTVEGVPLAVNYAGGDGNDLTLTAGNVPPQISPISTTPKPVAAGQPSTATVRSSGYGADFALTVPNACVRKGTPFSVTLSIKRQTKGKGKGNVLVKVTKVVFAIDGKTVKTARSAPFRVQLTAARTATSPSTIKLRAKAYLKIHGGKRRAKSVTVAVKLC
jgi:hypothetical protein